MCSHGINMDETVLLIKQWVEVMDGFFGKGIEMVELGWKPTVLDQIYGLQILIIRRRNLTFKWQIVEYQARWPKLSSNKEDRKQKKKGMCEKDDQLINRKLKAMIILILFKMPKGHKKQVVYCVYHEFSLSPLRDDLYLKHPATLSYCKGKLQTKKQGKQSKKIASTQNCGCFPIFNVDRNHATSTFILPQQQQNFIENSEKLKLEHQQRVFEYNDQKSKMLVPKPKTKYSYCSTCKTNYEDYLEHIYNETHKNNINKSKYTGFMRDLERKYEASNRRRLVSSSKNFDGSSTTNQYDIGIEELGRPQKRVKLSGQDQQINNSNKLPSSLHAMQTLHTLNSMHSMPMPNYGPNIFYPGLQYPMEVYPGFPAADYSQINPFGFPMMNNPFMCWHSYQSMFGGLGMNGYSQCKPVVIDLEGQDG